MTEGNPEYIAMSRSEIEQWLMFSKANVGAHIDYQLLQAVERLERALSAELAHKDAEREEKAR
jgi:hypothetical protein